MKLLQTKSLTPADFSEKFIKLYKCTFPLPSLIVIFIQIHNPLPLCVA